MLQPSLSGVSPQRTLVSNPISGEVGAAADVSYEIHTLPWTRFQTPSAGRWVLQLGVIVWGGIAASFQTPSAGRWVLQHSACLWATVELMQFQTPSAGRWVLQLSGWLRETYFAHVSNPISGEVGAAAPGACSC